MYLTAAEYATITGRSAAEATTQRLTIASRMLDSRIGRYTRDETTGYKLVLANLDAYKSEAVQQWVAAMVEFLVKNNDAAPSTAAVRLGRFSVSHSAGQQGNLLPESMRMIDSILIDSGLVVRGIDLKGATYFEEDKPHNYIGDLI